MGFLETIEPKAKNTFFNNVFFVGLLSFFGGIAQDIFLPMLPLYMSNVLGLSKEFIGLSQGLVTSSASIFKIVAGYLSDRFRKNKPIVFAGYFLSMIGRMFLAVVTASGAILFFRFLDGVGKGIKDPAKDVLISGSTKAATRGKGFGIARALDTLGSVVGPIILFFLLYFFTKNSLPSWRDIASYFCVSNCPAADLTPSNPAAYQKIIALSAIPLVATLIVLIWKVKEIASTRKEAVTVEKKKMPLNFFLFLGIMTVFTLGNSSDTFLILRAQNVGVEFLAIPLVYALFNLFYASASIPLGSLSDKIGREKVMLIGFISYALAYLGFGYASASYQIWLLFAFYGIYFATTEGVAKALVADLVPKEDRGKAYGIYNSAIGVVALPATTISGFLWDRYNPATPFFFGAGVAFVSAILLIIFLVFVKKSGREE